ncbi:sigma-70 family RNA polymerase sigma factor [Marvinbryantia formatexigens]|uniref:sigma-70 family RNA polymerase sigma factor n=1 Tax=Marvinbryantia formatexigens TaxID=168384 RepID=UPI000301DA70|nr:sigma-70 family RNA polymerase sigma factor [Marvinbryantia formatexigens]UWO25961.1 sigma-70 family RNA polymerase sigma factor [Marvinbryantia formatexigens DSM 14469]
MKKKIQIGEMESPMDEMSREAFGFNVEESLELEMRERLLMREAEGVYPQWNEITDKRLQQALFMLREDERKLIYQHVFEEWTFEEMSRVNNLPLYKVKGLYYYAIRKIRKWMGDE